jgi:gamma-glutamyltranspeptidase/glutathione hydrolase
MRLLFKKALPILVMLCLAIVDCSTSGPKNVLDGEIYQVDTEFVFQKAAYRPVHINMGPNGGVASGGPMGPSIGLKVLMDGGNAIDAAITAAVMSTVTQYSMNNIGGHGGMTVYLAATKEVKFLNWGGHLPNAFNINDWGNPPSEPPSRDVANTVLPGTLKGWEVALQTYGTISLAQALAPAIEYAEKGFPVYPALARHMASVAEEIELYPDFKKVIYPEGRPPVEGEILAFPDLANTYKRIAREGTGIFYGGDLGKEIVSYLNEHGSKFTIEEFANYQPCWDEMLKTTYRGQYEIYAPKNQNFTPVVLEMINMWENFDLPNMHPLAADTLHVMGEVHKIALADRVYYGDPDFSVIPYDTLVSKAYGNAAAGLIKMNKVLPDIPAGDQLGILKSAIAYDAERSTRYRSTTTSIAAVDKWGNVVLITQTIGAGHGSMNIVPGTGIILNNEGTYFDLHPVNGPNYPGPGKRVENQMGGVMVLKDGKFYAGAATPTGWQIPLQIAEVLQRMLDYNLNPQEAIELPRYAYQGLGLLMVEPDVPKAVRDDLSARGHEVIIGFPTFGMVAVKVDPVSGAKQVAGDPVDPLPTHSVTY